MALTTALIDTGPLVAYLDATDAWHQPVATALDGFIGTLCTTDAVVTEAMHLLQDAPSGPRHLAEFLAGVGVQIFDCADVRRIFAAVALMEQYADTPMDFADATLVLLGEDLDVRRIFTLDRRGFSAYRTRRQKAFQILPGQ